MDEKSALIDLMSRHELDDWTRAGQPELLLLGECRHCGERVWGHDDPGECVHGTCHGQCISDYCEAA